MAIVLNPKRVVDTALCALGWVIDLALLCYFLWYFPIWTLGIAIVLCAIAICILWYWRWPMRRG